MKRHKVILATVLGLGIFATQQTHAADKNRIFLTGSSTVAPLVAEAGRRYESQHPNVRIDVETGGSSRGIADARREVVDIGMVSRALKPEESDLKSFTIAWDGVAIIVHHSNQVPELTPVQVRQIYTGKIVNWKELGGADKSIVVVNKAQGRSTLELFLEHFGLKAEEVKAHSIIGDNQQGIKLVAGNPSAIGYVSVGAAEYEAESSGLIRILPLNGIESSSRNVLNGSYPLRRPLNLVVLDTPQAHVAEFLSFLSSGEINDLIKEFYFVPPAD